MCADSYKSLIGLFVTCQFRTLNNEDRLAKGVLRSIDDNKLFIQGTYKSFIIDQGQVICITGMPNYKQ